RGYCGGPPQHLQIRRPSAVGTHALPVTRVGGGTFLVLAPHVSFEVIHLQVRTQVRDIPSSTSRFYPAAPPHGIVVRSSWVTADARRSDTPRTSPPAPASVMP